MSRKMLLHLNGNKNSRLLSWLNEFKGEPRIAWYPSSGTDFRDLLYLNPRFVQEFPATGTEPQSPDIFLHSDYYPWSSSSFLDTSTIYSDDHTSVSIDHIEELPRCALPLDKEIVDFPGGSSAAGKVIFMEITIKSDVLGDFSAPVIYAFVENGAFCAKKILTNEGLFSHVIHIRYGGGCGGGGTASGVWLLNVLRKLKCECFITDNHHSRQSGDERTCELYPELAGNADLNQFGREIRVMRGKDWSNHGDVSWNIIRYNEE